MPGVLLWSRSGFCLFRCLQAHFVDVFLQTPVVVCHDLRGLRADIAEVPRLGEEARQLLLFPGEADDEAVFIAVLVQPFLLRGAGEADAGNGDIEGEAGHMLARSGGRDGLIGCREAAVA